MAAQMATIGQRTFLHVQHADLDRVPREAGNRAAGVEPLVLQDPLGIVRGDLGIQRLEDLRLVFGLAEGRFGNHLAGDCGDLPRVRAVDFQPVIQEARDAPFDDGRTGGQRRQNREHQADRRVQPGELVVIGKRQVQMRTLQVGPAMPPAAEDAIEGPIDFAIFVRPEPRFGLGVHPGMHPRRHQPRTRGRQERVDFADVVLKQCRQRLERTEPAGRP